MANKDQTTSASASKGATTTVSPEGGTSYIGSGNSASLGSPGGSGALRKFGIVLVLALLIGAGVAAFLVIKHPKEDAADQSNQASGRFGTVEIPLSDVLGDKNLKLSDASNVTINGALQLNNSFTLAPSVQPTGAKPGQIYFDEGNNQLAYYNGSNFVFLSGPTESGVQSLGGATGQLSIGGGLSLDDGQLVNGGVLSVQGRSGAVTFTAGAGIVINGTNFSNSGVLSITAGTPNVTVANDGSGGVTISVTGGGGSGTVASSGGTSGSIPMFTAAQNVENSIISQSGLTVTVSGSLNVTSALTLGTALTVANGGTGAATLTSNGVLIGNGTSAITSVVAGGVGLCLLSTAGAPTWGACSSGGVSSLNSLTGALSIANASGAGSTITIDNASTSAKGIASFNSSNFSVTAGAVNTIQDIGTGATPTFTGVNTNAITPSGALTVGATGQSFTLQGSAASTITATNAGNTTTISFTAPTAARAIVIPNASGTICLQSSTSCGFLSSSDTDVAKLSATQAFTGVNSFRNTSTSAFSVQNAAGTTTVLGVNTSSVLVRVSGAGSDADATSGTGAIQIGDDASGNLAFDTNEIIARNNGSMSTLFVQNGGGGLTVGANATTFQNASNSGTAFRVLNAAGNSLMTVDTTEGELELGQGSTLTGTLLFRSAAHNFIVTLKPGTQTAHRAIVLPDEDGTLCIRSSTNCGFALSTNPVITGSITVNGHIISGGSTPAIAAGAAACTTPTVSVSGNDTAGLVTVTSGTGCSTGGKLATITFNSAFGSAPRVVLTAAGSSAAGLHYYVDQATIATTSFDVTTQAADTITDATTYRWYYHVIQ